MWLGLKIPNSLSHVARENWALGSKLCLSWGRCFPASTTAPWPTCMGLLWLGRCRSVSWAIPGMIAGQVSKKLNATQATWLFVVKSAIISYIPWLACACDLIHSQYSMIRHTFWKRSIPTSSPLDVHLRAPLVTKHGNGICISQLSTSIYFDDFPASHVDTGG